MKNNSNRTLFAGRVVFSVHAEQAVLASALKAHGLHHLLPLLHAEIPVKSHHKRDLARARRMFKGMTLVVQRTTSEGTLANAMPCAHCRQILLRFGISTVEYSTPDGWVRQRVHECRSRPTSSHKLCSHLLRPQ